MGIRMKSILQDSKECYFCHTPFNLELHHCYFGAKNRSNSDKHGFVVWLCNAHHTGYCGVHGNGGSFLDKRLKITCQQKFEETHTRDEFRRIIGRSYL